MNARTQPEHTTKENAMKKIIAMKGFEQDALVPLAIILTLVIMTGVCLV